MSDIKTPAQKLQAIAALLDTLAGPAGKDAEPFIHGAKQMCAAAVSRCEKSYRGQAEILLEILGDLEMVDGLPVPEAAKIAHATIEIAGVVVALTGNARLREKLQSGWNHEARV